MKVWKHFLNFLSGENIENFSKLFIIFHQERISKNFQSPLSRKWTANILKKITSCKTGSRCWNRALLSDGGFYVFRIYGIEEAEETVLMAIRMGVNFIDSGPHYGSGAAETFLGSVKELKIGIEQARDQNDSFRMLFNLWCVMGLAIFV